MNHRFYREQKFAFLANKALDAKEPLFNSKDDRIRKIKGMLISAINSAVLKWDKKAIKETQIAD